MKYTLRCARVVVFETEFECSGDDDAIKEKAQEIDMGLEVYGGIPGEMVPEYVCEIEDYDGLWEIEPVEGGSA